MRRIAGCDDNDESGSFADGPSDDAKFSYPEGVAVDTNGDILVCDSKHERVRVIR